MLLHLPIEDQNDSSKLNVVDIDSEILLKLFSIKSVLNILKNFKYIFY